TQHALLATNHVIRQSDQLLDVPTIRLECTKIWQQLTGDEQDTLLLAARGTASGHQITRTLSLKGLLHGAPDRPPQVFSPLFEMYLKTIGVPQPNMPTPIHIDVEHGAVVYYGRD